MSHSDCLMHLLPPMSWSMNTRIGIMTYPMDDLLLGTLGLALPRLSNVMKFQENFFYSKDMSQKIVLFPLEDVYGVLLG